MTRTTHLLLSCACTLLFAQGCVSSDFMPIGGQTFPPRPNDHIIDVYLAQEAPVQVYKQLAGAKALSAVPSTAMEIGRVDTVGAPAASWGSVVNDAKKKARRLGGDGLVIKGWGSHLTGVNGYGQAYHGKNASMTVIRY